MKRKIELSLKQAQELYKNPLNMKQFLLTNFTEEELTGFPIIKSWRELDSVKGWWINTNSEIKTADNYIDATNRNVYVTELQAKSSLAFAMLSQLMKDLGKKYTISDKEWNNNNIVKHTIIRQCGNIVKSQTNYYYYFLAFKEEKIADAFYEKNKKLIHEYEMLNYEN